MEELSWLIVLVSWVLFFVLSYLLLHYLLFKDYELRGRAVSILFSITFSTSCTLLQLFLLELSLFQVSPIIWKVTLLAFSSLMLYVIPFYLMFKLLHFRYLLWGFLIAYFYILELNRQFIDHDANQILHFSLVEQIKLLGINGVVISAFLSGFGAINGTYAFFNFFNEDALKVNIKELVTLCKRNIECLVEAKTRRSSIQTAGKKGWKSLWGVFGRIRI